MGVLNFQAWCIICCCCCCTFAVYRRVKNLITSDVTGNKYTHRQQLEAKCEQRSAALVSLTCLFGDGGYGRKQSSSLTLLVAEDMIYGHIKDSHNGRQPPAPRNFKPCLQRVDGPRSQIARFDRQNARGRPESELQRECHTLRTGGCRSRPAVGPKSVETRANKSRSGNVADRRSTQHSSASSAFAAPLRCVSLRRGNR